MSKILILDDEMTILDNLKSSLELENFRVLTFSNGQEGLSLLQTENNIDCIICDMNMPGMNGIEFTKAVQSIDSDIGVIILTGHGDIENAIEAMKSGVADYLNKPVNSDKLIFSIKNAIKKRNLIKENKKLQEELIRRNHYFQYLHDSTQQILCHMAPQACPLFDSLRACAIYKSCETVGGDMYDIFQLGKTIMFYVFDVCGHGLLSSVMTMMLKSYFQNIKLIHECTGSIPVMDKYFGSVNREMMKYTPSNLYVTLFAGVFDSDTHQLTYMSAGHVDQYLQTAEGITPLSSTSTVMGLFEEVEFKTETIRLSPGDRLFLFTDGLLEVWKDEVLKTAHRMNRIILDNTHNTLTGTIQCIYDNILNLNGKADLEDDMTLLGIEVKS